MTQHAHATYTPGCYRCELSRDEAGMEGVLALALSGGDGLDLRYADLGGAKLTGANLRDTDLTGANFRGAVLRGADLTDANLTDADLSGANLRGANLTYANLTGAVLIDVDLTGAILTRAIGLPEGLERYAHVEATARALASEQALREAQERAEELEGLLLDMGGYIGSDVFIRASNAHDMNVKCAQLTTELAAAERTVRELREALERIKREAAIGNGHVVPAMVDRALAPNTKERPQ